MESLTGSSGSAGLGQRFRGASTLVGIGESMGSQSPQPQDPKDAMRKAMERARLRPKARRSSSKFRDLATLVDFTDCEDPSFVELTRTLRAWFPPETER